MSKAHMKKLKTAIVSGVIAVSAVAAPMAVSYDAPASPVTASAADTDNYARLLQYSIYFYDGNMCGDQVGETGQLLWRDDCHTADEVPGGFHDAGDHVMFGLPQGFSASTLEWGYYEFKDAYDSTGQTAHFKTITDYFCKFFKDSTELDGSGNVTRFLYQKGEGGADHAVWCAPEAQQDSRKMFWTTNSASDIAAEYAASLAAHYLNFGNEEDLTYAKALYDFSTKYNSITYEGTGGFYDNGHYEDDQAWAAMWLYLATNDQKYRSDFESKQNIDQFKYLGWPHSWENLTLGASCLYAEVTGDWSKVDSYIGSKINEFGSNYAFFDGWGSARYNASFQLCALVESKHSDKDYTDWCKGQMSYLLGENPSNTCFVVGFADNSTKNPHHRAASGYNSNDESTGQSSISPTNGHVLVGALVGGPSDANGTYRDDMQVYSVNEVACDYNAGLVGAAAGLYDKFKTGTCDTSIEGAKPLDQQPAETTTTTQEPAVTTTTTTTEEPVQTTTTTTTTAEETNAVTTTTEQVQTEATTATETTAESVTTTEGNQLPTSKDYYPGDADCDGDIKVDDVVMILDYTVDSKSSKMTEQGKENSDVYQRGDGIQSNDAASVAKFIAKVISSLPEC